MHIRKGGALLAVAATVIAALSSGVEASMQYNINLESAIGEQTMVEQTSSQSINFWTNFRSFSWGLFLGLPGVNT